MSKNRRSAESLVGINKCNLKKHVNVVEAYRVIAG
jgi:hypothetical protein